MLLRWMVTQFVRQAAEQKLRDAAMSAAHEHLQRGVAEAMRGAGAPGEQDHAADADERIPFVCHAAILFGTGLEAGGAVDLLSSAAVETGDGWKAHCGQWAGRSIAVVETGDGAKSARRAVRGVIDRFQPSVIVSAGFAGALRQNLHRGHIVLVTEVTDEAGARRECDWRLNRDKGLSRGVHAGPIVSTDRVIRTPDERRELASRGEALACDMESMAIAGECTLRGVRFLAVRVITDALDDTLPPEIERMLGRSSWAGKLGVATGALFRRPGVVKDIWKLRDDAMAASDRLARFLTGIVQQLDSPSAPPANQPITDETSDE